MLGRPHHKCLWAEGRVALPKGNSVWGKPSCCHVVGVLKVSHRCDLLLSAVSCPAAALRGCRTSPSALWLSTSGLCPLKPWHHKQCWEQVRGLPGCIACTCTVSVDMAELVLSQPCWRLRVCVWECWSLEPLGARW